MQNLRIEFSKTGDAIYISHLDLMRCMQRAISRAGIPILYTEGFNPKPYMNFAMPLSLGFAGLSELVDIRIDDSMTYNKVFELLKSTMPPDIEIKRVYEPTDKATAVAYSKFKIEIGQSSMPSEALCSAVLELVSRPELLVSKLGKQGRNKVVKYINLTEQIKDLKTWESGEKNTVITLILPSNPQFGVNPNLFANKIFEELGFEPDFCHITRKALLKDDFSPLD